MKSGIQKAAVIGAGSMGGGIAAQFANAGIPVVLLDLAPEGSQDRKAFAKQGIERQLKIGGFMHPDAVSLITPGHIDDDLKLVADADWIIEAIIEDLAAKQALFAKLETIRKTGSIVSSNTSTIARAVLCKGLPDSFRRDFVISHFFNPPRHMRLLEIVSGSDNAPEVVKRAVLSGEIDLGKTVIHCRDTPGFIANRIGSYWMAMATLEAVAHGLGAEEADAVAGAPFGVPRTGVFGLFDLVGIDLVPLVWAGLLRMLPAGDGFHAYDLPGNPLFKGMLEAKRYGRKTKAGFYRQSAEDKKKREVVDFSTLSYRPERLDCLAGLGAAAKDLRQLCSGEDKLSHYAWVVLKRTVTYAATVAPEIADDVSAIDAAMELGYAWGMGPFVLADRVGAKWIVEKLKSEGEPVPQLLAQAAEAGGFYADGGRTILRTDGTRTPRPRPEGVLSLADIKDRSKPVLGNDSAALWDIGEGIACLELKTKMNIFDSAVFDLIGETLVRVPRDFKGLVIGNEHPRAFSAGASLALILKNIRGNNFSAIREFELRGQHAFRALKYAPFPVVGAAFGLALGGGCEVLLHCDTIVAHAELNAGLPEINVGLIPGWGGCTQLLLRNADPRAKGAKDPVAIATRVFETIGGVVLSGSAAQARDTCILREQDLIAMSRAHLLTAARSEALRLAAGGYRPPAPAMLTLAGPSGRSSLMNWAQNERAAGRISETDLAMREVLARILTGDQADPSVPAPEETVYALEAEALVELAKTSATQARIEHMLAAGKPLRN